MSDSNLKKQINSLRNTLFDKDKVNEKDEGIKKKEENNKEQLVPANINSTNFQDPLVFFMI